MFFVYHAQIIKHTGFFKWSTLSITLKAKGLMKTTPNQPYQGLLVCTSSHYWAWRELLIARVLANAERLEPTEPPRGNLLLRWSRHRKEPACVVGEHRQLDLAVEDLLAAECDTGDASDCFLISSKSKSGMFNWRVFSCFIGGFWSTFSSIIFCENLN